MAEAHNEFTKAVTEQGLSFEEYASILDMARDNPEIRDKVLQRLAVFGKIARIVSARRGRSPPPRPAVPALARNA